LVIEPGFIHMRRLGQNICRRRDVSLHGAMRTPFGFSLIELLAVVTIIAILATIALPLASLEHQRRQEEELRQALRQIRSALDAYKKAGDDGHIPRSIGASGYPETLDVLVEGIDDARLAQRSKIYFLRSIPRDPLATDDSLTDAQTWGLRSYESPPDAPKPGKDVFDVYSKAEGSGLNGVPYARW
jgi:general secretion pathway protein G